MKKQILTFVLASFLMQPFNVLGVVNFEDRDPRFNRNNRSDVGVELYKRTDFRGEYISIQRDWSCEMDRDFCLNIESIFVPQGFEVWAYQRRNFRGEPIVLNDSWNGRERGSRFMRNQIKSIRVVRRRQAQPRRAVSAAGAQVVVYDRRFRGREMVVNRSWTAGRHNGFLFNDQISAIYVPRGFKVRIYEHTNFSGAFMDIYGDWAPNRQDFWNNRISSMEVIPLNQGKTRRIRRR